jgi:hypothetical protein
MASADTVVCRSAGDLPTPSPTAPMIQGARATRGRDLREQGIGSAGRSANADGSISGQ